MTTPIPSVGVTGVRRSSRKRSSPPSSMTSSSSSSSSLEKKEKSRSATRPTKAKTNNTDTPRTTTTDDGEDRDGDGGAGNEVTTTKKKKTKSSVAKKKSKPKAKTNAKKKSTTKKATKSKDDTNGSDNTNGYSSIVGGDGQRRCEWGGGPVMANYHDNVWGRPMRTVASLFESLSLQGMQSGLSWRAVCNKMTHFTAAFANWDYNIVADYNDDDIKRLMDNADIIRNTNKIKSIINNARCIRDIEREHKGGFVSWIWQYEPTDDRERLVAPEIFAAMKTHMRTDLVTKPEDRIDSDAVHPTITAARLTNALKKRGFKFVGPTTVLSFMQAAGLMNHHRHDCYVYKLIEHARTTTTTTATASTTVDDDDEDDIDHGDDAKPSRSRSKKKGSMTTKQNSRSRK